MIDEKSLKIRSKELFKEGLFKQEIYEELANTFGHNPTVADAVRYIPERAMEVKYGWINYSVVALVIINTLFTVLSVASVVWPLALVLTILFKFYKMFWIFIVYGLLSILGLIAVFAMGKFSNSPEAIVAAGLVFVSGVVYLFYGIKMPKIMIPPYEEYKVAYLNSEGEERLMRKYRFPE